MLWHKNYMSANIFPHFGTILLSLMQTTKKKHRQEFISAGLKITGGMCSHWISETENFIHMHTRLWDTTSPDLETRDLKFHILQNKPHNPLCILKLSIQLLSAENHHLNPCMHTHKIVVPTEINGVIKMNIWTGL